MSLAFIKTNFVTILVPKFTSIFKATSLVIFPFANCIKLSAIISCDQAGAVTIVSPLEPIVMVEFFIQVFK